MAALTVALDTSTRRGSVALGLLDEGGVELLGEEELTVSATSSETVLPALDRLVRRAGRRPGEVRAVAVGAGPGSFTGVRIAAALARGLCFPGRAVLYAWSSLAAVAAGAAMEGVEGDVCAVLDARRGQVYAAGYGVGPEPFEERFPPSAGALAELLARLDAPAWRFAADVGSGQREAIEEAGGILLPVELGRPRAAGLLRLAALVPESGRVREPARWEPEYVRSSSAERRVGGA